MRSLLAIVLVVGCAPAVTAQGPRATGQVDCEQRAQEVAGGKALRAARPWAHGQLPLCGAVGGRALAAAIRANASNEAALLDSLTQIAFDLRDADVLQTSLDIASSNAASVEARILAIRTLIYAFQPTYRIKYSDMVASGPSDLPRTCIGESVAGHKQLPGSPVSESARGEILELGSRLMNDQSAPKDVRAAAMCIGALIPKP